ncbi:MAG: S8 family serine peptidase [Roseibacillus sp.]
MKPKLIPLFALLILFAVSGNRLLRSQSKENAVSEPPQNTVSTPVVAKTKKKNNVAVAGPTFTTKHQGQETEFILALDEAVERLPEGKDITLKLDPPATIHTLASRLSTLKKENPVVPVCYQKGREQNLANRRIVTRDLTIELTQEKTVPALPKGITLKEQPSYAPNHAVVSAKDPLAALAALEGLRIAPGVKEAEVQLAIQRSKKALPNDTLINDQWHLKTSGSASSGSDINVEDAWLYGGTGGVRGHGIRIGIVDDGLQTAHPDLAANVDTANDFDWNGNDNSPEPQADDDHGTACAGNAAAVGNNNLGVSGSAPEATLVGMRLIAAGTTDSQEADALSYLPDLIEIKSNSWGPDDSGAIDGPGSLTRASLANAATTGRNGLGNIILWAGGNGLENDDNSNYDGYANDIHTISVGASNSQGQQSFYSESGANLVVVGPSSGDAPALGITTTDRTGGNGYQNGDYTDDFGGTSSSTPTVAGIVALMLEKNPALGWRDVQEILITSASKIDSGDSDWITNGAGLEFNHKYGSGLADATAAVALSDGWTNLVSAESDSDSASNINLTIPDNNSTGVSYDLTLDGDNLRCEHVTLTVTATHPFRGDLAITLTSPNGTESELAETRGTDDGGNYAGWTFSTVRNWGEDSNGTWTVTVADGAAEDTGTLTALTLTAHGTPATPRNPGPSVAISSPANNSVFSPGATVTVSVTATDLTTDGSAGVVSSVELFDGATSLGSDTTAPYSFTFNPALGSHSLTAVALDSEGESRTSAIVLFSVVNQVPVVTAATLSPSSQAFSDEDLIVSGITANDPEGASLTYNYAWESSSDGATWGSTNFTGATLAADPAHAGLLWRAQVTANDGVNTSTAFTTSTTNSLTRPPSTIAIGESISYAPGLVLRGSESTLAREAIINEFSQGVSGSSEWVELLVLSETSLRNWSLGDTNSGAPLSFADATAWDSVPAGTLIIIYNGSSKDSLLPADDSDYSDNIMVVASNDAALFTGNWPGYGNGGDAVILSDASDAQVAAFSYGNQFSPSPSLGSVGSGTSVYYSGSSEPDASLASFWQTTTSTIARSLRGPRVATSLPIIFGGDWGSLPPYFTSSGMSTYGSSLGGDTVTGSAKFDGDGDEFTVEFDSAAGSLNFQLKGNTGGQPTTTGTFIVEESTDNTTYSPLRTITDQSTADTAYTETPSASARFIRFRYEDKVSGNIQLDKLEITAGIGGGPDSIGLTVSPTSFSENAGTMAATGTITIAEAQSSDLIITLTSSDPTAATVPTSVTILASELSATFPIDAVDDTLSDGNQDTLITASATAFTDGTFAVTVTDDEETLEGVTPAAGNNPANTGFIADLRSGAFNAPALFRLASGTLPDGLTLDETTGIISGSATNAAALTTYPLTIERYNSFSEVVSFSFTLEVISNGGYSTWIAGQNVTDTNVLSDPDGDGLANLLEYYLDGDADSSNPEITPCLILDSGETKLGFWHLKSATDISGIVEWSETLQANSWSTVGVTSEVTIDEPTREFIEATVPAGAVKRFLRLRVE